MKNEEEKALCCVFAVLFFILMGVRGEKRNFFLSTNEHHLPLKKNESQQKHRGIYTPSQTKHCIIKLRKEEFVFAFNVGGMF
jgi:hypothetical protein